MNKILLACTIIGTIGFFSCKKEKTVTVTNTVHDTTYVAVVTSGKVHADSLTTGLKLAYATTVADSAFPAATTAEGTPVLDTMFDRTYTAQPGSFLTIYPPNVSGYVKGYYVQIVGAHSYFKIDFPAVDMTLKTRAKTYQGARGNGDGPNIDSTIAIRLPAAIKGDTFYIKYAAYDESNHVSNAIIATVKLLPVATGATIDSLKGTWIVNGYKSRYNGHTEVEWYFENYYNAGAGSYYACDGQTLSATSYSPGLPYYYQRMGFNKYGYIFSGSSLTTFSETKFSVFNLAASTCADTVYTSDPNLDQYNKAQMLGYTFDAPSRKLTFYYSDDENDANVDIFTDSYRITSLTNNELILFYLYDRNYTGGSYTRFAKQ